MKIRIMIHIQRIMIRVADGTNGEDEDDHDPAEVEVDPGAADDFDLALIKQLSPTQVSPVMNGDDVVYRIKVYNQGDVSADNIEITDYIPGCMSLNDSDWVDNGDGTASVMLSVANGWIGCTVTTWHEYVCGVDLIS